jgi:hypothetical protein
MPTMNTKKILAGALALAAIVTLSACEPTETPERDKQYEASAKKADSRKAPDVSGDTEYNNYIRAQEEVYDDPSTIIWCTVYPQSPNAPIFTVPIQGKLTSSSVSFYPSKMQHFNSSYYTWSEETQSVDGMYHGSPPPYRYGFTPGGQYVDFTDLPTFCTTALTEFQKESLVVEYSK